MKPDKTLRGTIAPFKQVLYASRQTSPLWKLYSQSPKSFYKICWPGPCVEAKLVEVVMPVWLYLDADIHLTYMRINKWSLSNWERCGRY